MAASSNFLTSTVWSRVQSSLGKPIVHRCRELEDVVKTSSNKDLSSVLPGLLENIFGSGADPGWGLDVISRTQQPHEFEALVHLLGPEGPVMNLVYHLQTDVYLTYDFPFQNLPAPTRHMIEEGSIPLFYVNKLQYQSYTKPSLALNAFELYMFYFAHTLVSTQWKAKSFNWNNMKDVVYPYLLEEYLKFFIPLNKKSLPKFPQSHQVPVRSPLLQQQQQQTPVSNRQSPGSGIQTRSRSRLGLLKASVLSPQKQHGQSSPVHEKAEGEIWWSETFVQVIAEFWLNQNSLDNERGINPQNLSGTWGYTSEPFQSIFESFLPSNNHVRLTRLLLKHVHSFTNSAEPEAVVSQYQSVEISPLEEFKRNLIPSVLQKKLYSFFRHAFDRWPLDTSFRLLLEMWLTYLQPWRYMDTGKKSPHDRSTDRDEVHDMWFPFIRDNLLFYTVLFQEFLERSKRTQLLSVYHAYMMYRVSKVFSLPNLGQLLREAEKMMYPAAFKHAHDLSGGGSYIAPEMSPVLRIQIAELERADFIYINMFGAETEKEIEGLLGQIEVAMAVLRNSEERVQTTSKSVWESFTSMFESQPKAYGDMTLNEVKKLVAHLEQAKINICQVFSIKPEEFSVLSSPGLRRFSLGGTMHQSINNDQSSLLNQSMANTSHAATPDCVFTDKGFHLTPMGRYQLMHGIRKFDIHYQGDPDLQPIRSYENATMVRALYRLSAFVNKQYSSEIHSLYNRPDFIGRLAKVYFAAPLPASKVPRSPLSKHELDQLHTPRLSLRFLASYQTIIYLTLLYLFLQFGWNIGPVGYILFLCLCVLVFGLFRALLISETEAQYPVTPGR